MRTRVGNCHSYDPSDDDEVVAYELCLVLMHGAGAGPIRRNLRPGGGGPIVCGKEPDIIEDLLRAPSGLNARTAK